MRLPILTQAQFKSVGNICFGSCRYTPDHIVATNLGIFGMAHFCNVDRCPENTYESSFTILDKNGVRYKPRLFRDESIRVCFLWRYDNPNDPWW